MIGGTFNFYKINLSNRTSNTNSFFLQILVGLTAKRVQLKRQSDDLSQGLEMTCKNRDELATSQKQGMREIELQMYVLNRLV